MIDNIKKQPTLATLDVKETLEDIAKQLKKVDFQKASYEYMGVKPTKENLTNAKNLNKTDYKIIFIDRLITQLRDIGHPIAFFSGHNRLYTGKYWQKLSLGNLARFLNIAGHKMNVPTLISRDVDFINKCEKQLQMLCFKQENDSQREPLLNFLNGSLKFSEGKYILTEHSEDNLFTYILPYEYNPEATCDKFLSYLNQVIPEKDKQLVLSEFLGSIFSNLKHEKILILYGSGGNGKSVFLLISRAAIGEENVTSFSLESLTDSSGYYRAGLGNSLLNFAGEISTKVNPDEFKKLASGEPTTARSPFGRPYEIKDYGRLAFNCNHLPDVTDNSDGYYRRFLIIPFNLTIPLANQNKNLANEIIQEELPGIMNWILEGLERLHIQNGFTKCVASSEILEWYQSNGNSIESFINDSKEIFTKDKFLATDLRQKYLQYCEENDLKPEAKKTFFRGLTKSELVKKTRVSSGIQYSLN
ncbi:hypothetical protein GYB29_03455 [bacterium]|nr:hypothetical protein [bacterium]